MNAFCIIFEVQRRGTTEEDPRRLGRGEAWSHDKGLDIAVETLWKKALDFLNCFSAAQVLGMAPLASKSALQINGKDVFRFLQDRLSRFMSCLLTGREMGGHLRAAR